MKSSREYFNPIEWLQSQGVECGHITFDPTVVPQYRIRRGSAHDGTLVFTYENIWRALEPLVTRTSYYKLTEPPSEPGVVRYTVGRARLAAVYGMVDLPVGRYPGQRERVTVPVRCDYAAVSLPQTPGTSE
jgi:hypothetical protein